ncbi:MAG: hypothetical protein P8Z81_15635 [Deinococcales bacterium]
MIERIEAACERSGREPAEVTLVAITKGHEVPEIRQRVLAHGHRILGENRVQEWRAKAAALGPEVEWHLVGHLQRNKVRQLAGVHLIHPLAGLGPSRRCARGRGREARRALPCAAPGQHHR